MRWALLIAAAVMPGLHAEWIRLASPNFEFYTELPERQARETLDAFERARDFLFRVKPFKMNSPLPVTLVGFASTKAYAPYATDVIKPAYYTGDAEHDYIVMGYLGNNSSWVAVHEYVHLLVRHSGLDIPLWLNEGLADVYSTIETRDGRIVVGASPKGRVQTLTRDKWLRLDEVADADTKSKAYNSLIAAPVYYAESWLLTHMLMFRDEYSTRFPAFLERLDALGSSRQAFVEVYKKSLAQVQGDMNLYFRRSFDGTPSGEAGSRPVEIAPSRPATELEIGLTFARVQRLIGRAEESETQLEKLAAAYPGNAEIEAARERLVIPAAQPPRTETRPAPTERTPLPPAEENTASDRPVLRRGKQR